MKFFLDGNDWEADYFISNEECVRWQMAPWNLQNMLLDSAGSAGFTDAKADYRANFRATVPGCDRSVLLENGVIADPYFGRNMDQSRWSEKAAWGFRKRFTLTEELKAKKRFQLHFCGIDYSAAFFFNGSYLGTHTGAFLPFEADVTDLICRDGENMVAAVFEPMPQALPNHTDPFVNQAAEFSKYHRCQMSYGWDWARAMPTAGIWDHVYLNANDDVRIQDAFFRANASGDVTLTLETIAQNAGDYELKITLEPLGFAGASYAFNQTLALRAGDNQTALELHCANPALWYPRGYGKQNLYTLTLETGGEVTRRKVAFRTLEMRRNANSPDRAYDLTFTFNGVEIFARGSNWVPSDMMHSNSGAPEYERLVRLAAENHTNLFRVWGGGIIEKEEFYDACDRYGILVWQEFMHACSHYRKDAEYLAFKELEARAILQKLRNHVSVAMICGGNELLYYGEIPNSPLLTQYEKLTHELAPDLPFHTTCPDRSRPGERDHGPWHFIEHEEINVHDRLLASEVGCTGFAEFESVKKFIPARDLDNLDAQSWKYHFAVPRGAQDFHRQLQGFAANSTEECCQAVMATQSDVNSCWMEHYRRKTPHSSGCFLWQYNEPWPTLSLSIVDYYTMPKIAYYHLMEAQKPVILSLREKSGYLKTGKFEAELFLTADYPVKVSQWSFRLLTADGRVLIRQSAAGDFAKGSVKLLDLNTILPDNLPGGAVLAEMQIAAPEGTIFAHTRLYGVPDYKGVFVAPQAEISVEQMVAYTVENGEKELEITLQNGGFAAFYLRLALDGVNLRQCYWHANYITLAPGEKRTVSVSLTGSLPAEAKLKLRAWNMPEKELAIALNG